MFLIAMQSVYASPIKVGVIYGGQATGPQAAAQLNDDTYFDFDAVTLGASGADTLAELSQFDAVVLGDAGYRDNGFTPAMFAALRQYMDNGGGIVTAGWYNYSTDPFTGQQRDDADYITPIVDTNYSGSGGAVLISDSAHPIANGITNYSTTTSTEVGNNGVDPGAVSLGTVGSRVTIAYQDQVGRSVYLGGLYLASTNYSNAGMRSGVEDQIFEQAVAWAANGSSPVPEPSTYAMLLLGLFGLGFYRYKRK